MSVIDSGRQRVQRVRNSRDWRHTARVGAGMYLGMALAATLFMALGAWDFVNPDGTWMSSDIISLAQLGDVVLLGCFAALIGLPFAGLSAYFIDGRWSIHGWDPGPAIAGAASILSLIGLLVVINLGGVSGSSQDVGLAKMLLVELPLIVLYLFLTFGGVFIPIVTGATLGHRVATDGLEPRRLAVIAGIGIALTLAAGFLAGQWEVLFEAIAKTAGLS